MFGDFFEREDILEVIIFLENEGKSGRFCSETWTLLESGLHGDKEPGFSSGLPALKMITGLFSKLSLSHTGGSGFLLS